MITEFDGETLKFNVLSELRQQTFIFIISYYQTNICYFLIFSIGRYSVDKRRPYFKLLYNLFFYQPVDFYGSELAEIDFFGKYCSNSQDVTILFTLLWILISSHLKIILLLSLY